MSLDRFTGALLGLARLRLGDVESAHSSARMLANLVADKKRKQRRPEGDGR